MLHNKSVPQCSQSKQLVSGLHGLHANSRAQLPGGGRTAERELKASFTKCSQINVFSYSYLTSRAVWWPRLRPGHWAETQLTHRASKAELKWSTGWLYIRYVTVTGKKRWQFDDWKCSIFVLSINPNNELILQVSSLQPKPGLLISLLHYCLKTIKNSSMSDWAALVPSLRWTCCCCKSAQSAELNVDIVRFWKQQIRKMCTFRMCHINVSTTAMKVT